MFQINRFQVRQNNMIKIYRLLAVSGFFIFFLMNGSIAQDTLKDPVESIRELKEGYLVIRFPAFKNKIDTLTSMIARAEEGPSKKRLEIMKAKTIEERDSLQEDYIKAFQTHYKFSKVAYFMDAEARNLSSANFYSLDKSPITFKELNKLPVYYLIFGRTEESKIDALIIVDSHMKPIPSPFPNNFTRSGFNFLFITLAEDKFPEWRVKKMNKKLHKFYSAVN